MKTRLAMFILLFTIMMMAAPQASALDTRVLPNGRIGLYSRSVLGDSDVQDEEMDEEMGEETEEEAEDEVDNDMDEETDGNARREYFQKLREQRAERIEEMKELKSQAKENKKKILELKSNNIKARLKSGAEFKLDPVTNEVIVVTPSGKEHILNHLPDQAKERMIEAGLFSGDSDGEDEIDLITNEDGDIFYSKKDKIKRKLFGIFPRDIDSEIILDDATGEVMEYETYSNSIFTRFFNRISF